MCINEMERGREREGREGAKSFNSKRTNVHKSIPMIHTSLNGIRFKKKKKKCRNVSPTTTVSSALLSSFLSPSSHHRLLGFGALEKCSCFPPPLLD